MAENKINRPACISFLAVINAAGLILTVVFWGLVFLKHPIPYPWETECSADRANSAVTYAFMIGDVIYSAPLLLLAWTGLWRLKIWGWLAAQMTNALWIYSMTVILFRDAFTSISPGSILFTPSAIISVWAVPYLWIHRAKFLNNN